MSRALRRAVTLAGACLLLLGIVATPALAHGRGSDASNYRSRITSQPPLPGVQWRVYGADEYLAVTNTTGEELVVPGYGPDAEPYLRIGPDGVFRNLASAATYQNESRFLEGTVVPADVGPDVEPRWEKISDGNSWYWHDHRIHWMSQQLPPAVTDVSQETLVPMGEGGSDEWSVPFSLGGEDYEVKGELRWVPPPPPFPWVAGALVLTLPALLGLRGGVGGDWVSRMARPAAVVLAVVALGNVVNLVDDFTAMPTPLSARAVAGLQTAVFIGIGLFGALRGWQGRDGAFTALGVGSGAIFIGQGLLYLSVLQASQTASVSPDWLARAAVALSLAQVVPVGIVAVLGSRRLAGEEPPAGKPVPPDAVPVS